MKNIFQLWLTTQCQQLRGVNSALVLSKDTDGVIAAVWPEKKDVSALIPLARKALADKQCRLQRHTISIPKNGKALDQITCPLKVGGEVIGSAVITLACCLPKQQNALLRQLQTGTLWLESLVNLNASLQNKQLITLVELIAAGLEHKRFEQAALDIVKELAKCFSCDRVSIGFVEKRKIEIVAISSGARFDAKSDTLVAISDAMFEAVDQNETVVLPPVSDSVHYVTLVHKSLQKKNHIDSLCTIPLMTHGVVVGALMFERSNGVLFDSGFLDNTRQITALLGPLLEMRRREARNVLKKSADSTRGLLTKIFGPGALAVKTVAVLFLTTLLLLSVLNGKYMVSASAALEAKSQRAVVALQNGYIANASVRAGDIVQKGDFLGSLDNKDLKLEERRILSEHEQHCKEYRGALAQHDRSRTNIFKTKILQTKAQLNLLQEQLLRTKFLAPIDGLVVSGDLNQVLGSPVQQGQILFEIAPFGEYHVVLEVEDDDIREIQRGQRGKLLLSSMIEQPVDFTVTRITPVSTAGNGRNFFRVEANMDFRSDLLRPGMSGVAKISVDERKLIWIWTHKAFDWLRIKLWKFSP